MQVKSRKKKNEYSEYFFCDILAQKKLHKPVTRGCHYFSTECMGVELMIKRLQMWKLKKGGTGGSSLFK